MSVKSCGHTFRHCCANFATFLIIAELKVHNDNIAAKLFLAEVGTFWQNWPNKLLFSAIYLAYRKNTFFNRVSIFLL